ncbi:PREDICTED: uncharacterized protein LOC104818284 isoform X2 [Tarenaya hassleriana]|uniref:uncharacterized protein LOC104818284 isoform X2 n=1 Tax=Tarenaya hassleriana TaxID=28532 RepID=UPI00053C38F5|nr:PREDICTED: uncharacterized protein LOC104818284 isoform X2 [Tarenaya hassleriana]
MEFPPKMLYPRTFQTSPARLPEEEVEAAENTAVVLRDKLTALACRHEQVKIAYYQLHSHIKIGLVEAEEVFASLAIPLMKLVGLKTTEMVTEGRFAAVFLDADICPERDQMDAIRSARRITQNGFRIGDTKNQIHSSKEENYAAKVEIAGREILDKQQRQLIQLVQILRHFERQAISHQENILQMIDHHRIFCHEFIRKAIYYITMLRTQSHDTFPVTVKFLRVIFNNVIEVLGSVDCGVKDHMQAVAEKMCYPLAKHINNLTAEINHGPYAQLMNVVNEMERTWAGTRQELEDARARIRMAEEQARRAKGSLAFKRLRVEGSQENDEKILWELLRKKRKMQGSDSPMGTNDLIRQTNNKRVRSFDHQSSRMLVSPQTTCSDIWIPLGLSPSVKSETLRLGSVSLLLGGEV